MQKWKRQGHIQDSQQLWRVAKNTLGWTKREGIRQIDVNGEPVIKNEEIAENFNEFFVTKIVKINENIPETRKDLTDYTKEYISPFSDSIPKFKLKRFNNKAIRKVINGLKNSNSTSYDDISTSSIKIMANP